MRALLSTAIALCMSLFLLSAATGALAATTIHYTPETQAEFEKQLNAHQIHVAVFNKKLRSIRITTKNGEYFLAHYKKKESKPLEAQLKAKGVAVSVLNEAAANKEAREKPKKHKLRYIVGGALVAVIVIVGGVLLYNRRRRSLQD